MISSASPGPRPAFTIVTTAKDDTALARAVSLLPALDSSNQQLLAQAPSLMKSLAAVAPTPPTGGLSLAIRAGADGGGIIDIHDLQAEDRQLRDALSDALGTYLARSDCRATRTATGYRLDPDASTPPQAIDRVLAQVHALATMTQRIGGDEHALARLLKLPKASLVAELFAGTKEDAALLFSKVDDADPVADHRGVPRPVVITGGPEPLMIQGVCTPADALEAADLLAQAGLHAAATDLLLDRLWDYQCDDRASINQAIGAKLLDKNFDADTTAEILRSLMLMPFGGEALNFIPRLLGWLCCECDPSSLLAVAGALMDHPYSDSSTDSCIVPLLEAAFAGAVEMGDPGHAQAAIELLQERSKDSPLGKQARLAHERCSSQLQDQDLLQGKAFSVVTDNEFRAALKEGDKSFEFEIDFGSRGLELKPKNGTSFDPTLHADDLIAHADVVLQAGSPQISTRFAFPVVEFLLSEFLRLGPEQRRRVDALCEQCEAALPNGTSAPGDMEAATMARHLQQLLMRMLPNRTAAALEEAGVDAKSTNAACWLLKNRESLFGDLADSVATLMAEAGFELPAVIDPAELEVDEQAARKFLATALAPTVASLARQFERLQRARPAGLEHAALASWMTLTGTDDITLLTLAVQALGNTVIKDAQDWERVRSTHENAVQAFRNGIHGGQPDAALLGLHRALMQSIANICRCNGMGPLAGKIIDSGKGLLDRIDQEQATLLSLSKSTDGHPNAAVWPALCRVQLQIDRALGSTSAVTLTKSEVARIVDTITDCAARPGVVLDATLHRLINCTIQVFVGHNEFARALDLARLLHNSLIDRKEFGLVLPPTGMSSLVTLLWAFAGARFGKELKDVEPEATIIALVRALSAHSRLECLEFLDRACKGGLAWRSHLACLGFLQLAEECMVRGEKDDMMAAFVRSLEHLTPLAKDEWFERLYGKLEETGTRLEVADELVMEYARRDLVGLGLPRPR